MTYAEIKTELRAVRRLEILENPKSPEYADMRLYLQKRHRDLERIRL